jgi:hypothetical protein
MNRRQALVTIGATLAGSTVAFSANPKYPGVWGVVTLIDTNHYQYKLREQCINDFFRTAVKLHPNATWIGLQFGETWIEEKKPIVSWLKPEQSITDKCKIPVDPNGWVMAYGIWA